MSTLNENPKWILEGALLTSDVPLSVSTLRECLDKRFTKAQVLQMLAELQDDWQGRALELREVAEGLWRFQSVSAMREILRKLHPEEAPKYSRTVMETLAVIAYRQPVTRRQFLVDLGLNSLQDLPSIGPDEEPQVEAFELFEGQSQTQSASRLSDRQELKAIDDEHARLESLIQPLDFGDSDDEEKNQSE